MRQRVCDHCGHPSSQGWGDVAFVYMGKQINLDICPNCTPEVRRTLADFAIFNPDLFRGQVKAAPKPGKSKRRPPEPEPELGGD